jgi:hypothetical protein
MWVCWFWIPVPSFNTPFIVFNKLVLLLKRKKLLVEGVLVAGLVVDVCWC